MSKTIKVSDVVYKKLLSKGKMNDTFSDVIDRLLSSKNENLLNISQENEKILNEKLTPDLKKDLNLNLNNFLSLWLSSNNLK